MFGRIVFAGLALISASCLKMNEPVSLKDATAIPVSGNTWITDSVPENEEMITRDGLVNWVDPDNEITTYFKIENADDLNIWLRIRVPGQGSVIESTLGDKTFKTRIKNNVFDTVYIGEFTASKGYNKLIINGLSRKDSAFGEITDIIVKGSNTGGRIWFVRDDFYWGRRGPSVHLRYDIPEETGDIVWFYNEITITEGNDIPGSYFMADGFTDGYFGIQVNSLHERRVLFSVWSPYKTDNPADIPPEYKIQLLGKGEGVHAGEFGNEGSGGQSYLKYMWKAGTTYGFLLKGEPSANNSTDYSAYFHAPEIGKWILIASFRRPQGSRYLGNLYSFLENFRTETGCLTRLGYFSNQWVADKKGNWTELNSAKFTADATARKESRMDYAGGIENGAFFLKNCGFFSENTEINTLLERPATGKKPVIDLVFIEGKK